jgi:hypothetical protein
MITLSACSQQYEDDRGVGDAPVLKQDNAPKHVTGMPDQFPNVADACVAPGFRAFVTTRYEQPLVVLQDVNCK